MEYRDMVILSQSWVIPDLLSEKGGHPCLASVLRPDNRFVNESSGSTRRSGSGMSRALQVQPDYAPAQQALAAL